LWRVAQVPLLPALSPTQPQALIHGSLLRELPLFLLSLLVAAEVGGIFLAARAEALDTKTIIQ
jgi:hypothetical protein